MSGTTRPSHQSGRQLRRSWEGDTWLIYDYVARHFLASLSGTLQLSILHTQVLFVLQTQVLLTHHHLCLYSFFNACKQVTG